MEKRKVYNEYGDPINQAFNDLPLYPLDRDEFCEIFDQVEKDIYDDILNLPYEDMHFKAWRYDDEFYILHKPSGILVNWYKHLGRSNTCNRTLSTNDYKDFVAIFIEGYRS